ncbi:MAG: LytR/AlgR family response regulator transcription factor [Lachnospiraceae bacterium]
MIKIAVVDDEKEFAEMFKNNIERHLQNMEIDVSIETFDDPLKLIEKNTEYNLYFLDVDMLIINGLMLAGILRDKFGEKPDIIFVTAYEQAVFDTFKYAASGFIRKDYLEKELCETLDRVVKKWLGNEYVLDIKTKDGIVWKKESDIMYIETNRHYLMIHCIDGQYVTRAKMEELIGKIKSTDFIQPHKGYLVNCRYGRRLEADSIVLTNDSVIPVSRRNRKAVSELFFRYINGNR